MKLTREQAIAEHRKMWRWIAEETKRRKRVVIKPEYTKKYFPEDDIFSDCFCCEYSYFAYIKNGCRWGKTYCDYCPIDWDSVAEKYMCIDKKYFGDDRGLFKLWNRIHCDARYKKAAKLARQIAELPERKEH